MSDTPAVNFAANGHSVAGGKVIVCNDQVVDAGAPRSNTSSIFPRRSLRLLPRDASGIGPNFNQ